MVTERQNQVRDLENDLPALWNAVLPDLQMSVPFDLATSVPVVFRVGSHAHGTHVPPDDPAGIDDVDLMVICIPPPQYVLGLKQFEHAQYKHGPLDVVFYDWRKWLGMINKSNPNVVGTLFSTQDDMFFPEYDCRPPWSHWPFLNDLFASKTNLLSKRMYPAFVGYARGQLYKMTHFVHEGYMGAKRKALVEKFGYNVKNAAHMIRLLRMACETLETSTLTVYRPDAAELIAIKKGEWTKEAVIDEANTLFVRADAAIKTSTLPEEPNETLIQKIMIDGYQEWWQYSLRG